MATLRLRCHYWGIPTFDPCRNEEVWDAPTFEECRDQAISDGWYFLHPAASRSGEGPQASCPDCHEFITGKRKGGSAV
jgi:hypothetical protein